MPTPSSTPPPTASSTPLPLSECPTGGQQAPALATTETLEGFESAIIDYLNANPSGVALKAELSRLKLGPAGAEIQLMPYLIEADLTADAIPELALNVAAPPSGNRVVLIFGCRNDHYVLLEEQAAPADLHLSWVIDMNGDGLAEVVSSWLDCGAGCLTVAWVIHWTGDHFDQAVELPEPDEHGGPSIFNGDVDLRDVDADGRLELVLSGGWSPRYGPGRNQTDIWGWDNGSLVFLRTEYAASEFRIHAVYDADASYLAKEYDEALALYQRAIFDDKLLGWGWDFDPATNERLEDPDERPRLSAYSRYRIMLLHLVQGDLPAATVVFDTLQERFPPGSVGYDYAALAARFWETYQASNDTVLACKSATDYAANHPEMLASLGPAFYGDNNLDHQYAPDDVCPLPDSP